MKKLFLPAAALVALAVLANCSANQAIDATKSVPGKVDETNAEVQKTNAEVKKTNSSMEVMIAEVKKTNAEISKTNTAVHRQTLSVALSDMLKEENTKFLTPPLAMMPGAQVFVSEATPDELIHLVYVYLNLVEKTPAMPDEAANMKAFNRAKLVRLAAVSTLAGLAPQSSVDAIIKSQIEENGPFEQAAVAMLMLRYNFISKYLVGAKLKSGLTNPGMIAEAVHYATALSAIANLPYASKIGIELKDAFIGEEKPALTAAVSKKLNPAVALGIWKAIAASIEALDPKFLDEKSKSGKIVAGLKAKVVAALTAAPAPAAENKKN